MKAKSAATSLTPPVPFHYDEDVICHYCGQRAVTASPLDLLEGRAQRGICARHHVWELRAMLWQGRRTGREYVYLDEHLTWQKENDRE